jgi:diacylglycerol O-acyltransferase
LNDAVLAICGGALREYLLAQDALPAKPLVAMVPINLRDGESEGGNEIALILASLATHLADPRKRIEAVIRSTKASKARFRRLTPTYQKALTALSMVPAGVNILSGGRLPGLQTFNVVVSNMPGPKEPIYWNGARLDGVYPVAFLMDHMALNITLMSYVDHLEFGLTACRRTLPSMQKLLPALENAIAELERAAGLEAPSTDETTETIFDEPEAAEPA